MAQMIRCAGGPAVEAELIGSIEGMYDCYRLAGGEIVAGYSDGGWVYEASEEWVRSLTDEQLVLLKAFQAGTIEWPF